MTDRHQRVFARKHTDLFGGDEYDCDFYNYSQGSYDPDEGEMTGQSRSSFATGVQAEIVPPGQDSTVDTDGTSFSWSTSIRVPETSTIVGSLVPLGDDAERPTEVEITDPEDNATDRFELHSYTYEKGSGFIMCRLVEQ
jgi:hypothetical protein